MTNNQMLTLILSILIPLVSGFGWMISMMFKMTKEISENKNEISETKIEILNEIRVLDSRISHMEGSSQERSLRDIELRLYQFQKTSSEEKK